MTRKDLFIVLYSIMNFVEESLVDSISYIDETDCCYDELKEFIFQNYPSLSQDVIDAEDEVMGDIEKCDAVEICNAIETCSDTFFISPYILADYLVSMRPDLVNKYYEMWQRELEEMVEDWNNSVDEEDQRSIPEGYGEPEFEQFEQQYKGNHK